MRNLAHGSGSRQQRCATGARLGVEPGLPPPADELCPLESSLALRLSAGKVDRYPLALGDLGGEGKEGREHDSERQLQVEDAVRGADVDRLPELVRFGGLAR